jgi:hypothetical protein
MIRSAHAKSVIPRFRVIPEKQKDAQATRKQRDAAAWRIGEHAYITGLVKTERSKFRPQQ